MKELVVIPALTLFFVVVKYSLPQFIVSAWQPNCSPQNSLKLQGSLWRLLSTTFSSIIGFLIMLNEQWFFNPSLYIISHTRFSSLMLFYYFFSIAFYFTEILTYHNEPVLKDRRQMLIHHFATLILLLLSESLGFLRFGVVILLLHDFSDPLMESAKLANRTGHSTIANTFFAFFAFFFFVLRLYVFPTFIISSAIKNADYYKLTHLIIIAMLCALQVMHIMWSWLILRIIWQCCAGNNVEDPRSEQDEESNQS